MKKILILGVGNILLRDEGLGVRVVEKIISEHSLPDDVEALDGGTLGLTLLPYMEGREAVFIVDAIDSGERPGNIFRLEGDDIDEVYNSHKLSAHQIGLREVLSLLRFQGYLPRTVCLFGIQPQTVDIGLELSEPVSAGVDELIERLLEDVRGLLKTAR
ncbi:MAG: HyaD/HybD family hydrogenase maturation endopeptidase [Planctomycetota bacterium]|jgi:hydrogenase maturation protease